MELRADLLVKLSAEVGESPYWDSHSGCLWWVDLLKGELHKADMTGKDVCVGIAPGSLGFIVPRVKGQFVAGVNSNVGTLNVNDNGVEFTPMIEAEPYRPGYRINDGKADSRGRVWFGTMCDDTHKDGKWFCIDEEWNVRPLPQAAQVPNGLGWTADGRIMYQADSGTRTVSIWEYSDAKGIPTGLKRLVILPEEYGAPDGLTVDQEGYAWVACWGGWCVLRISQEGDICGRIHVPAKLVASCTFGGTGLDLLLITTATYKLPEKELVEQPLAGSIFVCDPGTAGLEADRSLL